jgi:hypothetical protein
MKNTHEYDGFAINLTNSGARLYIYNEQKISIYEFLNIEFAAYEQASKNKQRLFKVYETNTISFIGVGLN